MVISPEQYCYSGIINWDFYNIAVDSPMNGTMIYVYGAGEFNVPDDKNKWFVGITHCGIYQITCE